jgi:hypothetical protein
MHGMANGMIMSHSIFADTNPAFIKRPNRRRRSNTRIRHKKLLKGIR